MINSKGAQIEQVLVSLISNSVDALHDVENPFISIVVTEEDGYASITVEDNGEGIPAEIAPKIMTTFYSTKPTGQGTGMGLSIAKSIIQKHQGNFILESLSPARFKITLPLVS